MDTKWFEMGEIDIAWCPGCGNFAILTTDATSLMDFMEDPYL
jgi:pyruvate/2-oxoacid:ferredoxin oxidoreductase beta subunit